MITLSNSKSLEFTWNDQIDKHTIAGPEFKLQSVKNTPDNQEHHLKASERKPPLGAAIYPKKFSSSSSKRALSFFCRGYLDNYRNSCSVTKSGESLTRGPRYPFDCGHIRPSRLLATVQVNSFTDSDLEF